jgi:hypothetical protein
VDAVADAFFFFFLLRFFFATVLSESKTKIQQSYFFDCHALGLWNIYQSGLVWCCRSRHPPGHPEMQTCFLRGA